MREDIDVRELARSLSKVQKWRWMWLLKTGIGDSHLLKRLKKMLLAPSLVPIVTQTRRIKTVTYVDCRDTDVESVQEHLVSQPTRSFTEARNL